ncbi:hypothetical protein SAY86_021695 [Trapa natans]|uniref:Uncharacterized protein n=1 Tax=Trapa natans TaxID=22666 RepID=A0AAN7M2H6_TRANT|nr:hypothetical protein SAY86_021695 [Trapa natans]
MILLQLARGMIGRRSFGLCPAPVRGMSPTSPNDSAGYIVTIRCLQDAPKHSVEHSDANGVTRLISAHRLSRVSRNEAQRAILDYLQSDRGLSFTDAEHISKNSPRFLENLLSNVKDKKDVFRSMRKLLRYNPINEFEPFFESVGLNPSELPFSLSPELIFLKDDHLMLKNFHILCDYGILRSKMGKIFEEATEIFWYEDGVLTLKLRAYEELGLQRSTVVKLISSSPSLLIGSNKLAFVKFLEKLANLGIENGSILRCLSDKISYDWCRILDSIEFLEKLNLGEEQMRRVFRNDHVFLLDGSGKGAYVLFGQLLKVGISVNGARKLFAENPRLLSRMHEKNLYKALRFLFYIRMDMVDIVHVFSNHMKLVCLCPLKGPRTACRELRVQRDSLRELIKEDPLKLFHLASKTTPLVDESQISYRDPRKHLVKAAFLRRLGLAENSEEMAKAVKQFRGRADQLQERFDCLVRAGLDVNVVSGLVKQVPMVLNQSKDVIVKKIDYLTNNLGYPLEILVSFPAYLCYDKRRIMQRFSMYAWSKEKA